MTLSASVVVRTKDEADRLRLTLYSLAQQTTPCQVVVVDDGSQDHSTDVLANFRAMIDLRVVRNRIPLGRSLASNMGASAADGDIVIFLDGDTLAGPDMVANHISKHRESSAYVLRGETWHLRCTKPFRNPETGTPWPEQERAFRRIDDRELCRSLITTHQVCNSFHEVERRAQPGIYPGYGPRKLFELEMESLVSGANESLNWLAASGSNQSMHRAAFLDSGGFHADLTINEHRELALRLCRNGYRMRPTPARTYHMTHRSGWRDPLEDTGWQELFYRLHPLPEVALVNFLWASLSNRSPYPKNSFINTFDQLERTCSRYTGIHGIENLHRAHLLFSESTSG